MTEQIQTPELEVPTTEQIDQHYASALDSVNLINGEKPEHETEEEWAATIERNKAHLEIMVAKEFWADHDLAPLHAAIAK
jgi:hypothetical protein